MPKIVPSATESGAPIMALVICSQRGVELKACISPEELVDELLLQFSADFKLADAVSRDYVVYESGLELTLEQYSALSLVVLSSAVLAEARKRASALAKRTEAAPKWRSEMFSDLKSKIANL